MGDLKARIKAKLLRRHSAAPTLGSSKPSLGQDRASSSTRTRTSTTGYAASLSTAATNDDRPSDSSIRSDDSPPKKIGNGFGVDVGVLVPMTVPVRIPSQAQTQDRNQDRDRDQNRDKAETVPPELEKQLNLAGNSNVNNTNTHNTHNTHKAFKTVAVATNLDGDVDVDANANGDLSVNVNNVNNLTPSSSTTSKTGKDLQISTINSAPIPDVTAPILSLDLNNTISTAATPLPLPLPSINEHPAAASFLQLKPRIIDQNHHHHHHQQKHQLQHRDNINDNNNDNDNENNTTDNNTNDYLHLPISSSRALSPSIPLSRPTGPPRRQSILPSLQTTLIKTLLHTGNAGNTGNTGNAGYASSEVGQGEVDQLLPISGNMVTRKVWVKRPLASPTLITINEEDLVDDVRDMILRKYANSLGRQYDSPDLTLRICDREQQTSRTLQPDEPMGRTLDAYYPGGQSVDDALLIDIPSRRTPKASPNPRYYADDRPHESATDYFPPYPPAAQHANNASTTVLNGTHQLHFPPSLTVINGGQLPPLPSPGGTRRLGASRPKIQRMHTASPVSTVPSGLASQPAAPPIGMHNYPRQPRSRTHSGASSEQSNHPPAAPAIPTPPIPERTATPPPPPRVSSPRLVNRPKKKKPIEHPLLPPGMLNGGVPPINVLIVEDNIINLKLLEAFVKRLKVRWQTAMNGREAVNKWRAGGFHLVLMDIQLPVMSGLEATREIRRIEKVNSIGVFSSSASSPPDEIKAEPAEEDKLVNTEMFKSPVIIVALTASSLQSDRHEALAAGCNDFLTKVSKF